jgi:hypothetical protein
MIEVDYSKMASFVGNVSVLYLFVFDTNIEQDSLKRRYIKSK